jgi:cytochrome c556
MACQRFPDAPQSIASMNRKLASLLLLGFAASFLAACGHEPPDIRPGQPVAHRRAAFKEILRYFEPMGVMLREDRYDPVKFKSMLTEVMVRRDAPWQYFQPDTLYPPSHAKPEVWSQQEKFVQAKQAFMDATDKLAAVAGTQDKTEAGRAYAAVMDSCKRCHDDFKTR